MRSGKTANYELDQWTKSDQILMEDFNADNAKIDEALRAVAESNPYRKIISILTQSDAQQIDLDASGIDFAQYHKIELFVDSPGMTSGYILRVNGISASSYIYNANSGSGTGGTSYNSVLAIIYGHGTGAVLFYSPAMTARVGASISRLTSPLIAGSRLWGRCTGAI